MTTKMIMTNGEDVEVAAVDTLVPDSKVRVELGMSAMKMWRLDHDPAMAALDWPPPVRTNTRGHKSRWRSGLEKFKQNLAKKAIAERAQLHARQPGKRRSR
jgi:hypothetical protein